jgi:hypothetical protein
MDRSHDYLNFSNSVLGLQRPLVTFQTPKSILFHNPHKISDRWIGQSFFFFSNFVFGLQRLPVQYSTGDDYFKF